MAYDTKGIEVGHAINNAVQLAIADKDISLDNIRQHAISIMELAADLKSVDTTVKREADEHIANFKKAKTKESLCKYRDDNIESLRALPVDDQEKVKKVFTELEAKLK